jgi:hypothetical protein
MQLFDVRSCVCKLRRVVAQFRLNLVCRLFDHLTDQICFATICRFKFLPDCFRTSVEQPKSEKRAPAFAAVLMTTFWFPRSTRTSVTSSLRRARWEIANR